jgi:hypothetical protein
MVSLGLVGCARPALQRSDAVAAPSQGAGRTLAHWPVAVFLAPDAFDTPLACEHQELQGTPVPWQCAAAGDVDLGVVLPGLACRVPVPPPGVGGGWCRRGLSVAVAPQPRVVRAGKSVVLLVAVTNVLDDTRLVDVDPTRIVQVFEEPVDAPQPSLPGQVILCLSSGPGGDPNEPSGPERVRLLLAPHATVWFHARWRATWTFYASPSDGSPRCSPVERPLPPGRYRLSILGPVIAREPFETQIEVR